MKVLKPESEPTARVDGFKSRELQQRSENRPAHQAQSPGQVGEGRVAISALSRELGELDPQEFARSDPDQVRADKVERFKHLIRSGDYEFQGERLAPKVMRKLGIFSF